MMLGPPLQRNRPTRSLICPPSPSACLRGACSRSSAVPGVPATTLTRPIWRTVATCCDLLRLTTPSTKTQGNGPRRTTLRWERPLGRGALTPASGTRFSHSGDRGRGSNPFGNSITCHMATGRPRHLRQMLGGAGHGPDVVSNASHIVGSESSIGPFVVRTGAGHIDYQTNAI